MTPFDFKNIYQKIKQKNALFATPNIITNISAVQSYIQVSSERKWFFLSNCAKTKHQLHTPFNDATNKGFFAKLLF